jgi:hypothetical protein
MYYVYVWKTPEFRPIYVGCTTYRRRTNPAKHTAKDRNPRCHKALMDIGLDNVICEVHRLSSLDAALSLEFALIEKYGRLCTGTGTLTNLTPGGDNKDSEFGRENLKAQMSGDNNPAKRPETREKLKTVWEDPEYKDAQRQKKLGKPIHSEEHKEVLRQKALDPTSKFNTPENLNRLNTDPEIKAKRVAALLAPEVQAKISTALNDPEKKAIRLAKLRATLDDPDRPKIVSSEEKKRKISEAKKQYWANKRAGLLEPTPPEKAALYKLRNDANRAKKPKKDPAEVSRTRSENMKRLNADKEFSAKRIAALQSEEVITKISEAKRRMA